MSSTSKRRAAGPARSPAPTVNTWERSAGGLCCLRISSIAAPVVPITLASTGARPGQTLDAGSSEGRNP